MCADGTGAEVSAATKGLDSAGLSASKAIIRSFVIEILGCGCPEPVFQQLECVKAPGQPILRVLIGQRLLIYLVELEETARAEDLLPSLLAQGRHERDQKGYNRFRLVFAADQPEALCGELRPQFASLAEDDEKAHLHVLPRNAAWARVAAALADFTVA